MKTRRQKFRINGDGELQVVLGNLSLAVLIENTGDSPMRIFLDGAEKFSIPVKNASVVTGSDIKIKTATGVIYGNYKVMGGLCT